MMVLRARTLAMGRSGPRPVVAETILALLNAGHHAGRARARLARRVRRPRAAGPLRARAARRGRGATTRTTSCAPPPTRCATPDIAPLTLEAKEGLALINGTDGMLGMLVLALADLDNLLKVADITTALSVEGLLGTDRVFAADLVGLRPQPGQAISAGNIRTLLAESPIVASHRWDDDRVQDAYSLRCAPMVAGAARDTVDHARRVAEAELRQRDRQPHGVARRPRRVVRQLPRRAGRVRPGLPGDRRRRGRRDRRAPDRPDARSGALARAAAVPDAGRRGQLGVHDRPVHAGRDGRREPPARRARERRLAADQRDAGGPRLDGLGRGAQAARVGRQPDADPRRRAVRRRLRGRPPRAAEARRRDRRRAGRSCATSSPGPSADRWLSPDLRAAEELVARRRARRRRSRPPSGRWSRHHRAMPSPDRARPRRLPLRRASATR